ncbi:MAG: hypothetical protein Q9221_005635 [Calogaya cf. arnoldii]
MLFKVSLAAAATTFALSVVAMPMPTGFQAIGASLFPKANLFRRGAEGEPYKCDDPDRTAKAKQKLIAAGAIAVGKFTPTISGTDHPKLIIIHVDLAIAMLENACDFEAKYAIGNKKIGDSAEIGVYRNNWHMIRDYCDDFKDASSDEWESRGMELQ